jgi:cell fate regulator YaaT (PSP1 superfamily)
MEEFRAKEKDTLIQARAMAKTLNLDMKVSDVQYQGDGRKAIFYYIADGRVDFRELIKVYAGNFRVKVEMKQIGSRQEAGIVGGIGSCGRELCCSTWLTDFKSVNTGAARYQNISINMQKLSGQCGRLKCCLNYELDTYVEASKMIPQQVEELETKAGKLKLQKTDILKGLLFYAYEGKWDKFYPFTIAQVTQLKENASKGVLIESVYEIIEEEVNEEKEAYEDLVGQISLDTLEKKSKKKKKKKPGNRSATDSNVKKEAAAPNNEGAKPQAQATNQNKPNENRNQQRRNRPDNRNRNRNQNRDDKGGSEKKE